MTGPFLAFTVIYAFLFPLDRADGITLAPSPFSCAVCVSVLWGHPCEWWEEKQTVWTALTLIDIDQLIQVIDQRSTMNHE
jgi:hypothetical protein